MIETTITKVVYQGDGKTTSFPFSFAIDEESNIGVAVYNKSTQKTRTLSSDFCVDTVAKNVRYPGYAPGQEPPATEQPPVLSADEMITIYRETEVTQLTNLGSKYPLPKIEGMSDKLTMILQELIETLSRAIKVNIGDPETPETRYIEMENWVGDTAQNAKIAQECKEAAASSADKASNSEIAAAKSQGAAATSEANAAVSERNAAASAEAANQSAMAAADSAQASKSAAEESKISKDWAISTSSPDGATDSGSPTEKTQSSRSWALYARSEGIASREAAQRATGVLQDAVATVKAAITGSHRVYMWYEGKGHPMMYVTDVNTGEKYDTLYCRLSDTKPEDVTDLWLKPMS